MALNLELFDAPYDTSTLLDDSTFSDCLVKSSDKKEFKLHRLILAQASVCFKNMLTTDMIESATKTIQLSENSKILGNLFDLIYKRKCNGDVEDFFDLIITTEKYLMLGLNFKCHETLSEAIDCDNAVKILIFAHQNDMTTLKELSLEFIKTHFEIIRSSSDWELLTEHLEMLNLAVDAYIELFKKNSQDLDVLRTLHSKLKVELKTAPNGSFFFKR